MIFAGLRRRHDGERSRVVINALTAGIVELKRHRPCFVRMDRAVAVVDPDVRTAERRENRGRSIGIELRGVGAQIIQHEPHWRRRGAIAVVCDAHLLRILMRARVEHEVAASHRQTRRGNCSRHKQVAQVINDRDVVVTAEVVGLARRNGIVDVRQAENLFPSF